MRVTIGRKKVKGREGGRKGKKRGRWEGHQLGVDPGEGREGGNVRERS